MDLDLSGRHALVCGASRGIGAAVAAELALLGADVTVLARGRAALEQVVATLARPRAGQVHDWLVGDAGEPAELAAKVRTLARERPLHVLVNNTGGPPGGRATEAVAEEFLRAFTQHVLASHALVQAVAPGMQEASWGRIVNVVSTSVREPIANLGVSNTVRGAVASWAKTLSRELGPHGITVNNVLPGYTRTDRLEQILDDRVAAGGSDREQVVRSMLASVPAGRFASAAEVAAAVAFLCTPAAAYINGVSLAVDGGRMQSI